jgi:RNA polymerase sigma-70 factor (ECF subfamily)
MNSSQHGKAMSEDASNLIRAAQKGDVDAFRALHRQFVGRTYTLCRRLLADDARAEDACQETFLKVWQQLPGFRHESSFATWVHSIAARCAIDLWRRERGMRLLDDHDLEALPDTRVVTHERDAEKAIAALPAQARAVFVLFAIEGHTHQEIAALLDIAEGSSRAHYHRARTLLKDMLRDA